MKPIRFDPRQDLAPIPFEKRICRKAANLKSLGLKWQPHAGCFVWDPESVMLSVCPQAMAIENF